MTVYELTEEQMNELRENHFWEYGERIPYETLVKFYEHISFVNDDFFCTAGK